VVRGFRFTLQFFAASHKQAATRQNIVLWVERSVFGGFALPLSGAIRTSRAGGTTSAKGHQPT
jgi:hypothetical protein